MIVQLTKKEKNQKKTPQNLEKNTQPSGINKPNKNKTQSEEGRKGWDMRLKW